MWTAVTSILGLVIYLAVSFASAQSAIDTNSGTIQNLITVNQKQNDRHVELAKQQAVMKDRQERDHESIKELKEQNQHLIKVTERIAAKLNVDTE